MNIAIAGCGAIAPIHIEAILKNGYKIAALCDIRIERAEKLNKYFSLNAKIYTDYYEMVDSEALNTVHICLPHHLHAEFSVYALKRNISVLCEKPIAISKEEITKIKMAAEKSKGIFGVCFQNRYISSNLAAKKWCEGKSALKGYFSVPWFRDENYYRSSDWRGKRATDGGGVLINQAIHTLDLMQWFLGEVKTTRAMLTNFNRVADNDVEDTAVCHFNFENDGRALFFATVAASETYPVEIKLTSGDDSYSIDNDTAYINGKLAENEEKGSLGKKCWGSGHDALIKDFYNCKMSGKKFPIDENEGAKVSELLFDIYSLTENK